MFQGKYYEQVQGAPMGSPISPLVANLFMEDFKARALSISPNPPSIWLRYVDDTFVVQKKEHSQQCLTHRNSLIFQIQFTTEASNQQGSLPFLDTLVSVGTNHSLVTTGYRKLTHTDQYLQWDSHHNISNKYSVFNTLTHRAQTGCSDQQLLGQELQHIRTVLSRCDYPDWVFSQTPN